MLDREIAGIRCRDVLDSLEGYLAEELDAALHERIEAHLLALFPPSAPPARRGPSRTVAAARADPDGSEVVVRSRS